MQAENKCGDDLVQRNAAYASRRELGFRLITCDNKGGCSIDVCD